MWNLKKGRGSLVLCFFRCNETLNIPRGQDLFPEGLLTIILPASLAGNLGYKFLKSYHCFSQHITCKKFQRHFHWSRTKPNGEGNTIIRKTQHFSLIRGCKNTRQRSWLELLHSGRNLVIWVVREFCGCLDLKHMVARQRNCWLYSPEFSNIKGQIFK